MFSLSCSCDLAVPRTFVMQAAEALLLDKVLLRSAIPDLQLQYASGFVDHLQAVHQQYIQARHLQPVKIVIVGPPGAGKTALASFVSAAYSLPMITLADVKAAASKLPAAETAAVKAGQTPPPEVLARLCRQLLADVPARNRGYVLDAFPSTLREARELFTDARDWTAQELADQTELAAMAAQAEADAAAASKGAKGKKPAGKDTKGGGSSAPQSSIDNVPDPRTALDNLLPNVLVRVAACTVLAMPALYSLQGKEEPCQGGN